MELLIVRHAIAKDNSPTGKDKDRPLSTKGREKFKQTCINLKHLDLKFDLLLDSPLLRSQETADIFCKYFSIRKRKTSSSLDPLADPSDLFLEIQAYNKDSVVIIGHQPFLTQFLSYCTVNSQRDFISLKRGSMAFLNFPQKTEPGSAIVKALLAPKYLPINRD